MGGKVWDLLKGVAEANNCVPHMLQVLNAARKAKLGVFYALHHRYRPGDYETWKYIAPIQKAAWVHKTFGYGTWGGEIRAEFVPEPSEFVATEHWCSSGFANTDLDLQLKNHGIHQLIVIGLIAHTCVEATVRYAAELGYEVTMVRDATADYSDKGMHAALDINMPELRQLYCYDKGSHSLYFFSLSPAGQVQRGRGSIFQRTALRPVRWAVIIEASVICRWHGKYNLYLAARHGARRRAIRPRRCRRSTWSILMVAQEDPVQAGAPLVPGKH
jgi:ureidoacrylate peracid hydrolase